jgi:hypothetical protein
MRKPLRPQAFFEAAPLENAFRPRLTAGKHKARPRYHSWFIPEFSMNFWFVCRNHGTISEANSILSTTGAFA